MALFRLTRYTLRPDATLDAERAMHAYATYVRAELPGSMWTVYRDRGQPAAYVALARVEDARADDRERASPGLAALQAALAPLLDGAPDVTEYELVTSTDLAPRPRASRTKR